MESEVKAVLILFVSVLIFLLSLLYDNAMNDKRMHEAGFYWQRAQWVKMEVAK